MTLSLRNLTRLMVLPLVCALTACDVRNELKDMHGSTGRMEKNTEKMVEITDRMEKRTNTMGDDVAGMRNETKDVNVSVNQMRDKMDDVNTNVVTFNKKIDDLHGVASSLEARVGTGIEETYDGLRQGDSSNLRRIAFQGMLQAKAHEKKLLEAAQYVAGYEFYFWRGFGLDNKAKRREELLQGATEQFFKDVYEIYNYSPSVFPLADPDMGAAMNREASFNALSAALHRDNPKQKENIDALAAKGIKIDEMNFLKIIQEGLITKINVEDKKMQLSQVPPYIREVINNEEVAIKLLQARWNFLAVAALDKNFHFKQNGSFKYVRSAWKLATKWELDFSKLNSGQIADQNFFLKMASETREFLKSIGVKTKPDFLLVAFINRMKPTNVGALSDDTKTKAQENLQILESFKQ